MRPRKHNSGEEASKKCRTRQRNGPLQLQEHEEEHQEKLQQKRAEEQAEQLEEHEKEPQQSGRRSCKKRTREVDVVQERQLPHQPRQAVGAVSSVENEALPQQAAYLEPSPGVGDVDTIVPCTTVGAADDSEAAAPFCATDDAVDSEAGESRHAVNATTFVGASNRLRRNGGEERTQKSNREYLDILQSANDREQDADELLNEFIDNNGKLAQIIQCRSLDQQAPPGLYELLLPLIDRALTQCFSERPAECRRLLRDFIASAPFSDGLCRPTTLKRLSRDVLRHLVAVLQLVIQEIPSEHVSDTGGYCAFPVDFLRDLVHSDDTELHAETERLVTHLRENQEFKRQSKETLQYRLASGWYDNDGQPTDYQQVSLLPTETELKFGRPPDLASNRLEGLDADAREYIATHFRLLREDFVGPLRNAVKEYVRRSLNDERLRRFTAGSRVYRNVILLHDFKMNAFRFKMPVHGPALDSWQYGKSFACGSLVLISRDDFRTIMHATVLGKCRESDGSAVLVAQIVAGHRQVLQVLSSPSDDSSNRFTMIESESHFEAYRHECNFLQRMNPTKIPFRKYLVEQTSVIDAPTYLRSESEIVSQTCLYDLSTVVDPTQRTAATVDVLDDKQWPSAAALNLDESQAEALKFALTNEFAIIHGPPGTGKTHVGTKIVEVLLENEKAWTETRVKSVSRCSKTRSRTTHNNTSTIKGRNIVMICNTNHALDQFLDHIVRVYPEKLVRVEGNCGNAALDQYNIKELIKKEKPLRSPDYWKVQKKIRLHEKVIELLCKGYHENLTWIEAAQLLPSRLAEQIGSDELWKRWRNCADLAEAATTNYRAEQLSSFSYVESATDAFVVAENFLKSSILTDSSVNEKSHEFRPVCSPEDSELLLEETFDNITHVNDSRFSSRKQYVKNAIHAKKSPLRMSYSEIDALNDMWRLDLVKRHCLLNTLQYARQLEKESQISEHVRAVAQLNDTLHELTMQEFLTVFKDRPIVGMTVTGAAKYSALIRLLKPRIVIVQEAAEVLEAHVLATLTGSCQHLVLIGDHQQLRPKPRIYEITRKYDTDASMFERMVKHSQIRFICLKVQRRMRPEISKIITPILYKELLNHSCVEGRPNVKGLQKNVFFVNYRGPDGSADIDRSGNLHESGMVVALCGYLLKHAYNPKKVTVLVSCSGQLFECKRGLKQYQHPNLRCQQIRVTTVDNYQGQENDIIILSLERSNERGPLLFPTADSRIYVALSRARLGFYCFGDFEKLSRSDTWRSIAALLLQKEEIGDSLPLACPKHPDEIFTASKPEDFFNVISSHACPSLCNERLLCGHSCSDPCHLDDSSHTNQHRCRKSCLKPCAAGKHKGGCRMQCCQPCEPCREGVQHTFMDCGHTCTVECSFQENDVCCVHEVPTSLICEHETLAACHLSNCSAIDCQKKCWVMSKNQKQYGLCGELRASQQCFVMGTKTYESCGHQVQVSCHALHCSSAASEACALLVTVLDQQEIPMTCQDFVRRQCQKLVERRLACGHTATTICSDDREVLCTTMVNVILPRCRHEISAQCCDKVEKIACWQVVTKELPCGHGVNAFCSKNIEDICCTAIVEKSLACGHKVSSPCSADPHGLFCKALTRERLPCGHEITYCCGIRPQLDMACHEMTTKELPCSHDKLMQCSEDVNQQPCGVQVIKNLPCGHQVQALCSQDTGMLQCRESSEKELPCGHKLLMPCFDDARNGNCQVLVTKQLPCGHDVQLPCCEDIGSCPSLELVEWKLPCGHVRRASCHLTRCVANGCHIGVQIEISSDTNGASSTLAGDCESLKSVKCTALVSAMLPCGHQAELACSEMASAAQYPCAVLVDRRFDCGHSHSTTCHVSVCRTPFCPVPVANDNNATRCGQAQKELTACGHLTRYALPCGHGAAGNVPCHATRCTNDACLLQLAYRQRVFDCRELRQLLANCSAPVYVQLACGHNMKATCQQSRLCTCIREAGCGGDFVGGLSQQQQRREPQSSTMHTHTSETPAVMQCTFHVPCGELVEKELECGHRMTVACRDSSALVACTAKTTAVVPTCGHAKQAACASRMQEADLRCEQKLCALTCSHGGCISRCSEPCQPCTRRCAAGCKHSGSCSRPCFRPCSVPPCDELCGRVLSCGHPCLGLCGETCPNSCVGCPEGSYGQELLRYVCAKFAVLPNSRFLRLQPCGHEVPLEFMDNVVKRYEERVKVCSYERGTEIVSYRVRPLLCPSCREPVGGCRRYDAVLKRYFGMKRKLPTNVTGEWLECSKGHVFSAHESPCSKCNGNVGGQSAQPIGKRLRRRAVKTKVQSA